MERWDDAAQSAVAENHDERVEHTRPRAPQVLQQPEAAEIDFGDFAGGNIGPANRDGRAPAELAPLPGEAVKRGIRNPGSLAGQELLDLGQEKVVRFEPLPDLVSVWHQETLTRPELLRLRRPLRFLKNLLKNPIVREGIAWLEPAKLCRA